MMILSRHRISHTLLPCVIGLLSASAVHAAPIPWRNEPFEVTAQGKPLPDLLRELAARNGVAVSVDKTVKGTVNGSFNAQPGALLELLASNFGFIWYYDGVVLEVTPASDIESQVISLGNVSIARARSAIKALGIADDRFPVVFDRSTRTAKISGPSRYVGLVTKAIGSVGSPPSRPATEVNRETAVRVVPLTYAWAGDFSYTVGGRTIVLPGVASTMARLYDGNRLNPAIAVDDPLGARGPGVTPLTGNQPAYAQLRALGLANLDPSLAGPDARAVSSPAPRPGDGPEFVAEGRMNAVLVRDAPDRLDAHESAIRSLDVKPGLVEIEARIIEVNADATESLGIDWRFRNRTIDAQIGAQGLPSLGFESSRSELQPGIGPAGPQSINPSPAGVLTTVLGDAGRYLITRVSALAEKGQANLLSSPKVLTLDNVEAVMEDVETFFVRVAGNLDVNLFDVSVGTTLRVTPLIVEEDGRDIVKLAIAIEDGSLSGARVDNIPIVRRSRIRTQSIVGNGEALLIAGYTRESTGNLDVGVPGLSSIPVLGWLFKSRSNETRRVERLFLLTPRIMLP